MAAKQSESDTALPPEARITRLRQAIARANDQGLSLDDMVLRLTLSDVAALKRHPSVAADEITFVDGAMRFLGVEVAAGAVQSSELAPRGEA